MYLSVHHQSLSGQNHNQIPLTNFIRFLRIVTAISDVGEPTVRSVYVMRTIRDTLPSLIPHLHKRRRSTMHKALDPASHSFTSLTSLLYTFIFTGTLFLPLSVYSPSSFKEFVSAGTSHL